MHRLFQGVENQPIEPTAGEVSGSIPTWLEGSLYRNGPGVFAVGDTHYDHWFDGLAVVHRFHIAQGQVTYQRRPLESDTYKANMAAGRIIVSEFGTRATPASTDGFFKRLSARLKVGPATDNASVTLHWHNDSLYAASESNFLLRLHPKTLEVMEKIDISKQTPLTMCAAHTHSDRDGSLHFIGYIFGKGRTKYSLARIPPGANTDGASGFSQAELTACVGTKSLLDPSYYHSFAMTSRYYVFMQQPLSINAMKIITHNLRDVTLSECFEWQENQPVVFTIVDRKTGEVVNPSLFYQADPFFSIHHINAFEEHGNLVVDVITHKDASIMSKLTFSELTEDKVETTLKSLPPPSARRFVLPLDVSQQSAYHANLVTLEHTTATTVRTGEAVLTCRSQQLSDTSFEFPTINYSRCNGRKYRFVYGVSSQSSHTNNASLVKVDVVGGQALLWTEADCVPSEAIFVPSPKANREDDGVVLSVVTCLDQNKRCFLLIMDAGNWSELARIYINAWIPRDQHGIFVPNI